MDEAHKVSWGVETDSGNKAFRETFSRIGELRSFIDEKVPALALSATVDNDYSVLISSTCSLSKNLKVIHVCSDRPNIRLAVTRIKEKTVSCFHWVFNLLRDNDIFCPKILFYCRTQSLVGWLFEYF